MEQKGDYNVVVVFLAMIKSRMLIDFIVYKATECSLVFENIWCCRGVLCSVVENEIFFILLIFIILSEHFSDYVGNGFMFLIVL